MIQTDREIASMKEETDEVVCSCYEVKASTIKMAILSGETRSIEDISELTNAGSACRACICRIERIILGFPKDCVECSGCPSLKSEKTFGKSLKII